MYEVRVPRLSERAYLLKELFYEEIVHRREFLIKVPRLPKKEIWKGKEELRKELMVIVNNTLKDEVIKDILSDYIVSPEEFKQFVDRVKELLSIQGVEEAKEVAIHLAMSLMGYDVLGFILLDDNVEEIVVNGPRDIFVYLRGKGYVKANLSFPSRADLYEIADQIAYIHGKKLTEDHPFLDASLPDGSRVNISIPPATPESPTITIRKFSKKKLSILDLIRNGTMTSEAAAFLWLAVEGLKIYPMNILVIGGTASGKTTTLNALLSFIPLNDRIITIEDTREIYVPHPNRVHMVAYGSISMDDLLINSLRMRPDRIIVGEVRGPEAHTLFQAMDVGHRGVLGTLHANSAKDAKERLIHSPMNVPEDMLPLVNYYVVMKMFPDGRRRVVSIAESVRTEGVAYGPIFSWRNGRLVMENTLGQNMEVLAEQANTTVQNLWEEFRRRKEFLENLVNKSLGFLDAFKALSAYSAAENPGQ